MTVFITSIRMQSRWLKWLAIALMVGIALQLAIRSTLVVVEYLMEGESIRTLYRSHFGSYPWQGPAQTVLWVVILAPLIEEFCFRNGLFRLLRRFTGALVSGVICTLLFAAIHLQHPSDPLHWVIVGWIVVMGALLQLLYCASGSTWVPIAAHATGNAIAIAPLPMLGPVLNEWGLTGMQSKALFMSGVLLIAVSALAWCGQRLVKRLAGVVLLRYYVQDKDPSNLRSLLGLSKHKDPR